MSIRPRLFRPHRSQYAHRSYQANLPLP